MGLLEREAELDTLSQLFTTAAGGRGGVALVSGEAGIGKTSLVGAAVAALPARARVLRGACDDLIAPRSFGPAAGCGAGDFRTAGGGGRGRRRPGHRVRSRVRRARWSGGPVVLVVEDVHWADDATLDLCACSGGASPNCPPSSC